MNSRFRGLAALLALLALSLFWVEGLWASMCSADMEMEMPVAAQATDAGAPAAPPMARGQTGQSHEQDGKGSQAPDCPLTAAGAASCTGAVALAPSSAVPSVVAAADEFAVASSDHAKDLLLAISLLRPPRA